MRSPLLSLAARHPVARARLRRRLRAALAGLLRLRSRPYVSPAAGPILLVAPHPDDGTLGCGGLVLLRRLDGLPAHVIYLTDGSASHPGHPRMTPAELAHQRRVEAHDATARLGVDRADLAFLNLPDGTLDKLPSGERESAIEGLRRLFAAVAPVEVLTPCRLDGSSEHEAGFLLVREGLRRSGLTPRLLEYPIWAWWNPLRLAGPLLRARHVWRVDLRGYEGVKQAAIGAYASQTEPTPPWTEAVLPRDFVSAFAAGEEFLFEME